MGDIGSELVVYLFIDATAPEGNVEYSVRAYKDGDHYSDHNVKSVFLAWPPVAPAVEASSLLGTVTLSWNANLNVDHYEILRRVQGTSTWTTVTDHWAATSYTDATAPDGIYDYAVVAHKENLVSAIIPKTGNVDLTWNAVEDAVRYSVWIRTVGGTWTVVTTNAGGTSYSIETALTGAVQVTVKAHTASVASGFVAVTLEIPDVLDEVFGDYDPDEELLGV